MLALLASPRCAREWARRSLAPPVVLNFHPPLRPAALEHRLAELHLVMPILGGGEEDWGLAAAGDVFIDGAVVHLVAVGEAFGVATGIIGEARHVFAEAGGGALEDLVRLVAPAENDLKPRCVAFAAAM